MFLTDRKGLPLAMSTPEAGNHHDLYDVDNKLKELFGGFEKASISVDGFFQNRIKQIWCRRIYLKILQLYSFYDYIIEEN